MIELRDVDLRSDPEALSFVKDEAVTVSFAAAAGALRSGVGMNRYAPGDALVTGSDGDTWCVSRERFDARYAPVAPLAHGASGRYRNRPRPVLARRMREPFRCQRTAGGDWLLQYAPGDHGIATADRFAKVYRPATCARL